MNAEKARNPANMINNAKLKLKLKTEIAIATAINAPTQKEFKYGIDSLSS